MNERYARALGAEIRIARKARSLSRRDLAEKIERPVAVQTVASWEGGVREIGITRLMEISDAFGMPAYELVRLAEEKLQRIEPRHPLPRPTFSPSIWGPGATATTPNVGNKFGQGWNDGLPK